MVVVAMGRSRGLVLGLLAGLTFLTFPAGAWAAKQQVTFWDAWSGADQKVLEDLIARFEDRSGIDVKVMSVAGQSNLLEKALVAMASGAGPDVLVAHSVSFGSFMNSGLFADLKPLMKAVSLKESDFQKDYLHWTSSKGQVLGLPFSTYWNLIGYNQQVFAECGLDPSRLPRDIDQFDIAAAKLAKVRPDGTIDRMGFQPWNLDWYVFPYIFGGKYFDEAKARLTVDGSGVSRYMQWCQSYGNRYNWPKMQAFYAKAGNFVGTTADCPLYKGKVAMMIAGMWFAEYGPKLSKGTYGFAPFPYPKDGVSNAYLVQGSALMMPKSSKNKKAAMEFMKYIMSDDFSSRWFYGVGNLPATASGMAKLRAENSSNLYRPFFEATDGKAFFLPLLPNTVNLLNTLDASRWDILSGKRDVTQALTIAQEQLQKEYLRQMRSR